jgi:hypothetical protein
MAVKKDGGRRPMPTLVERDDGTLEAVWPVQRIRFMFSGGRTVDVVTTRDDSDLRGVLLAHCKAEQIVGHTTLVEPSAAVSAVPGRRAASRPVERPVDPPDGPQQHEPEHHE